MKKNYLFLSLSFIIFFSLYINYFTGNLGIIPIDSFAYFDTAYLILKGNHPFKDFWITTGFLVDYLQALFFLIGGTNWTSYVLHASVINCIFSVFIFLFFIKNNLNIYLSLLYAVSASILFYPTIGTPFAYHHGYFLSVISILILCLIIKNNSNFLWFFLPISMVVSFLCMQAPSAYINLLILIFTFFIFLKRKIFSNILYFFTSSLISIFLFYLYFQLTDVQFQSFLEQYILFPLTIGSDRISNAEGAFVSLGSKLNLKSIFLDFKFIHLLLGVILYVIFIKLRNYKSTNDKIFKNLILILIASYIFIFNQLVTANQIYIFSLIPIIAGFGHIGIKEYLSDKKFLDIFIIVIVLISTVKYHERFNINRKFIDLENKNLSLAINANQIDDKFKNLKWITVRNPKNPDNEIKSILKTIEILKQDKRKKMIISHYQFFSIILEEDLNNPNRWYTHDNNSYPLKNNRYFRFYKKFFNNKVINNQIEVIYIMDDTVSGGLKISNFKEYLNDICFIDKNIIKNVLSSHTITKCKIK